jgi:hypothetical protein
MSPMILNAPAPQHQNACHRALHGKPIPTPGWSDEAALTEECDQLHFSKQN